MVGLELRKDRLQWQRLAARLGHQLCSNDSNSNRDSDGTVTVPGTLMGTAMETETATESVTGTVTESVTGTVTGKSDGNTRRRQQGGSEVSGSDVCQCRPGLGLSYDAGTWVRIGARAQRWDSCQSSRHLSTRTGVVPLMVTAIVTVTVTE